MSPILSDLDRHAAADDVAEWAQTQSVVGCATLGCVGECRQGRDCCKHPEPAEACTELGADPKPRMGAVSSWERVFLDREFQKFLAMYFGAIFAAALLFWLSMAVTK